MRFPELENSMLLFISPSLRCATIEMAMHPILPCDGPLCTNHTRGLDILLDSLSLQAHLLESLTVEGFTSAKCASHIVRLKRLRRLDLATAGPWIGSPTFLELATLPTLSELHVNSSGLDLSGDFPPNAFQALQVLEISGTPTSIKFVFSVISSQALRMLIINSTYSFDPSCWSDCLEAIASRPHSALQEFHFKLLMGSLSLTQHSEDMMEVIRPLLKIPHLQVVAFDLEGPLRLSDPDLHLIASNWKDLRVLHLWCHRSGDAPTLQSVAFCTGYCPRLRHLELPGDARNPPLLTSYEPDKPSDALEVITLLGNVGVGDRESVAERIRTLCPRLLDFEAYSWDPQVNSSLAWVRSSLPSLRKHSSKGPKTWV